MLNTNKTPKVYIPSKLQLMSVFSCYYYCSSKVLRDMKYLFLTIKRKTIWADHLKQGFTCNINMKAVDVCLLENVT